jgi:hypothetical protein
MDLDLKTGLLIAILLVLVYFVFLKSEHASGFFGADLPKNIGGLNAAALTSGATMRDVGQVFSSTNQHLTNPDVGGYTGVGGLNKAALTAGATLRRMAQTFGSTNQKFTSL